MGVTLRTDNWVQSATGRASAVLGRLLGNRSAHAVGILVYHRVAECPAGLQEPTWNVRPHRFRCQLEGMLKRGCVPLPLQTLLDPARRTAPLPPRSFVVTFDDGFESVWTHAWPVLRDLQVPATVFVNTAFLGGSDPFPFDRWAQEHRERLSPDAYRPLSTPQCHEMVESGLISLGTHTHAHEDFRGREDMLEADLRHSADLLRKEFGLTDVPFAFPFGRRYLGFVSEPLLASARRAGVTCALTTECTAVDPQSDPFGWGRYNAYDCDDGATLCAKRDGWYGWAPRFQEWCARFKRRTRGMLALQQFANGRERNSV